MKADRKAELELKRQENRSKNLSPSCHSVDASLAFAAALVRIFPMRIRNAGAKNGSSRTRLPLQLRQSRYSVVERNTCYDVMHVSASCGFHFCYRSLRCSRGSLRSKTHKPESGPHTARAVGSVQLCSVRANSVSANPPPRTCRRI